MASKKSGGSASNGRNSAGQRLGVKRFSGETIPAGGIIMRQRGTKFHPGRNVKLGRDHTLFALKAGVIRFDKTARRVSVVEAASAVAEAAST